MAKSFHEYSARTQIVIFAMRIQTQEVIDGCDEVRRSCGVLGGIGSDLVRSTVKLTALNASSCEADRVDVGPMLAPADAADFGTAAELSHR